MLKKGKLLKKGLKKGKKYSKTENFTQKSAQKRSLQKKSKTWFYSEKGLKKVSLLKKKCSKKEIHSKKLYKKAAEKVNSLKKLLRKELKKGEILFTRSNMYYSRTLSDEVLVTWVPQSKLAFGHSARRLAIGPPALVYCAVQ